MFIPECTVADFGNTADSARAAGGLATFIFQRPDAYDPAEVGSDLSVGTLSTRGAPICLVIRSDGATRVGDHVEKVTLDPIGSYWAYPRENVPRLLAAYATRPLVSHPGAPAEQLGPRPGSPQYIAVDEAADLLADCEPARQLWVTGAGVSGGGEAPISTHVTMVKEIGLGASDEREKNRRLGHALLTDEAICQSTMRIFTELYENLYVDASTPAHVAIAGILRLFDLQSRAVTTNHDLKHLAKGSRLLIPEIVSGWQGEAAYGLSEYAEGRRLLAREALMACVDDAIDLAIIAGASAESLTRRGITHHLRENNPRVRMLAVDNSPAMPKYVGSGDYVLHGDAQKVLPALHQSLAAKLA